MGTYEPVDQDEREGPGNHSRTSSSTSEILNGISSLKHARDGLVTNEDANDVESLDFRRDQQHRRRLRRWRWRFLGVVFMAMVLSSLVVVISVGRTRPEPNSSSTLPTGAPVHGSSGSDGKAVNGKKSLSLDEQRSGKYYPKHKSIDWIDPVPGTEPIGDYVINENGNFILTSWKYKDDESKRTLITPRQISIGGKSRSVASVDLNSDHTKAILKTDVKKNWRHSTFARYWILDVGSQKVVPIDSEDSMLALAAWSPDSENIAYVKDNNVFLQNVASGSVYQITHDGGQDIFYGRPDWVYEEEVFSGASALWWSLNGQYLAFMKTNDTLVPEFPIPYFAQHGEDSAYPELVNIKYPKPGFDNPIVSMMFFDIEQGGTAYEVDFDGDNDDKEKLITEVVWSDDTQVLVRMTNRESDLLKIGLVDAKQRTAKIVRTSDESGLDGGWFEISQNTKFIPADASNGRSDSGYIDTIVVDGYNHLAYFSPLDAPSPKAILSKGHWEVDSAPAAVDLKSNTVYFMATERSPVERHLYSVKLDGSDFQVVTYDDKDKSHGEGTYSVSFSSDSRYALISYEGPDIPWQGVLDFHESKSGHDAFLNSQKVEENAELRSTMSEYALPTVIHSQVKVDDKNNLYANAMEIRPPNFNEQKKYPVLFQVYGGPVSQTVSKKFNVDFQKIMSSTLDAVVVIVDGRGTGFMGRSFRAVVRNNLGHYEVLDQITAAKDWAQRSYVDKERIAIWGWSYGGYMTLKTLETDAGNTFRYGMAVAPVTNWKFYDSIYTERYMHTPEHNGEGYEQARIRDPKGLGSNTRFLVMHGTGDDNVHFQNTLVLLDMLDQAGIENYDIHVFPDSDHSIRYHNANTIVYDKLHSWIASAFNNEFL